RYVAARAAGLGDLLRLEDFLVRALEPVLSPAPPAAWRGLFAVAVLDLRPLHEDFLPGAMAPPGPTPPQVGDRRQPGPGPAGWLPRAQAHWSRFLLRRPPADAAAQPTVAHIDLGTRQVALHYRLIRAKGLLDCVEALLAHEVGHHVRYPGTLAVQARLRLLEKSLLPIPDYSLINQFTDLLINEALGHTLRDQLVRVYQSFIGAGDWKQDPAFLFYLAVYEELWQMEPAALMGPA